MSLVFYRPKSKELSAFPKSYPLPKPCHRRFNGTNLKERNHMKNLKLAFTEERKSVRSDISARRPALKMLLASLSQVAIGLLWLFGGEARAQQTIVSTNYFFNGATQVGTAVNSGTGGYDSFLCTINMNINTSLNQPAGAQPNFDYTGGPATANWTWDPTAIVALGTLSLTGSIEFNDPNLASDWVELILTGFLAGGQVAQIDTGKIFANGVAGFQSVAQSKVWAAAPGTPATETLEIEGLGRIIYQNDDEFVGDVPEPTTFALLGLGTLSLLAYDWRRRKAKA
jgi:hypothetical protein